MPVLFSYHRSRFNEELPTYTEEGLLQCPVDITMQLLEDVARTDLGSAKKLFIISYPYPGIERGVELFHRHGWAVVYDCRDDWEEFAKEGSFERMKEARDAQTKAWRENIERTGHSAREAREKWGYLCD